MDRKELNSSINSKVPRLGQDNSLIKDKPTNLSSTAVNGRVESGYKPISGLNSASVGTVPAFNE